MRSTIRAGSLLMVLGLVPGCGGSYGDGPAASSTPAPAPAPTPTSAPIGTIEFLGTSVPEGSTVEVAPMFEADGQQAQQLRFNARITLDEDMSGALVRAWVRTEAERCMGGGRAGVEFRGGVPEEVTPASMSSTAGNCRLPYTTTHLEFEVIDPGGESVLQQQFPMTYDFVAEP